MAAFAQIEPNPAQSQPSHSKAGQVNPSALLSDAGLGRFFFEDFDAPKVVAPPPPAEPETIEPPDLVPYFTEQEVEAARRDGYAAGVADLHAATLEAHEAAVAQALGAIVVALHDAEAAAERVAETAAEGLARLLLRTLSTVMPALCVKYGVAEIDAIMRRILPQLKTEPRIVVQVSASDAEAIRTRLTEFASEITDRVELVAAESVEPGDVRLSWQDGEGARNAAALWREIAEVLEPLGLLTADDMAVACDDAPQFQ